MIENETVETTNDCLVGLIGETIVILRPMQNMSKETALRHAAWLVSMAGDREEFDRVYDAVMDEES